MQVCRNRQVLSTPAAYFLCVLNLNEGRDVLQAVGRWLPAVVARVRARIMSCAICGGHNGTGTGFLRVLRSFLPILIPPIGPRSSSFIIWGWYNRPNNGRHTNWAQSHQTAGGQQKMTKELVWTAIGGSSEHSHGSQTDQEQWGRGRNTAQCQFREPTRWCTIWGFHGGNYEEWCLLGCYAV
jgi:hypothetical protein